MAITKLKSSKPESKKLEDDTKVKATVEKILKEIKASDLPQILVLNQIDKIPLKAMFDRDEYGNITRIQLSAKTGDGIEFLKLAIVEHDQRQINKRNGQYA